MPSIIITSPTTFFAISPIPPPCPHLDPIRAICAIRAIRAPVATRSHDWVGAIYSDGFLRFYGPVLLCCVHVNALLQATPRHRDTRVLGANRSRIEWFVDLVAFVDDYFFA